MSAIANLVRSNAFSATLVACAFAATARAKPPAAALESLAKACRIAPEPVRRTIEKSLPSAAKAVDVTSREWLELFRFSKHLKTIILKPKIGPNERGVLFASFEDQWIRILRDGDVAALARDYELVIAPSWSPAHSSALLLLAANWPGRFYTLLSNFDDAPIVQRIAPNAQVVPLLASSWVHPGLFQPDPTIEKTHDVLMLASTAAFKRHPLLFKALRRNRLTALLIAPEVDGRDESILRAEARECGVEDRVTFQGRLNGTDLIREIQKARVSVILSALEGSNVAVTESMMAGVPAGVLRNARIGSKRYIVEGRSGKLLSEHNLARDLEEFVENAGQYSPRETLLGLGVDCFTSTRVLNETIKANSEVWTRDIVPHHWRPNPEYVSDAVRDDQFEAKYGFPVGPEC